MGYIIVFIILYLCIGIYVDHFYWEQTDNDLIFGPSIWPILLIMLLVSGDSNYVSEEYHGGLY